jgi:hypothetical protein
MHECKLNCSRHAEMPSGECQARKLVISSVQCNVPNVTRNPACEKDPHAKIEGNVQDFHWRAAFCGAKSMGGCDLHPAQLRAIDCESFKHS